MSVSQCFYYDKYIRILLWRNLELTLKHEAGSDIYDYGKNSGGTQQYYNVCVTWKKYVPLVLLRYRIYYIA